MSAPSPRRRGIPANKDRLWVNPCGFEEHDLPDVHMLDVVGQLTDRQMLDNIVLQAGNALDAVERFKHEYVRETFQEEFMKHHKTWQDQRYDWLPKFPGSNKNLGTKIHPDHLKNIELDEFLRDAYRYLQIMAVALEQVAWDQDDADSNNPAFLKKFQDIEFKLRAVLCEIQNAMYERKVQPHPDVDRDIMKDEFRYVKDNTSRNLRDWIIFRDYMIVLEYIREVFQHFLDNPSRITPS